MDLKDFVEKLGEDDTIYQTVESGGVNLHFGSLSAGDIFDYFEAYKATKGTAEHRHSGAKLVARSLVSGTPDTGTMSPVRLAATPEDLEQIVAVLLKKNPTRLAALVEAVMKLNGLNDAAAKEQAKNVSAEGQTGDSPTVLH